MASFNPETHHRQVLWNPSRTALQTLPCGRKSQKKPDRVTARPESCKGPAPPLLCLPPLIRHRIYRFVGLASWDGCPYIFDLHGGRTRKSSNKLGFGEAYSDTFHGLLLSCRDIHAEAAALLYSANRFVIHYTDPASFEPLFALTAPALSSIAALKIVLNQASCHQRLRRRREGDCCHSGGSTCEQFHYYGQHQLPLLTPAFEGDDDPGAAAQALLGEWHAAVSHLSSHMTPRRLELSLVCDIDSQHEEAVAIANSVVEPLRLLPLLRSCHIRLCKTPDSRLSQVAQDAVFQSCGIATPRLKPISTEGTVTFMTLPRELRLRILEFTDLITPNKEVWWSRQHNKYVWSDIGGGSPCYRSIQFDCQFYECWYRTATDMRARTGPSVGCFCRRRHAAFSATCTCWAPPALFLVCRTLYQEAQFVFFSANRFIVHDHRSSPPWIPLPGPESESSETLSCDYHYPYERLAASQFLREVIPTHCLAHLRFLELVFPPYPPPTWPQTDHPAIQDWRKTVSWLRDKVNGPVLTLRLVGVEIPDHAPDIWTGPRTAAGRDMIHTAYMGLWQPMKQLAEGPNALARFYADLPYPWQWIDESERRPPQGQSWWHWVEDEMRALKRDVERCVMGDRYDSMYANGKEEPGQSLWQHVFDYHHY